MKQSEKRHLSEHFTLYEFTRSGTAIELGLDNTPDDRQVAAMVALCRNVLEPLRQRFGPIVISSGFRSRKVNRLVGGVASSQHCLGEAADIVVGDTERARQLAAFVREHTDFDQMLLEPLGSEKPRWLHVSYTTRHRNRRLAKG